MRVRKQISGFLVFVMLLSCFNFVVMAEETVQTANVIGNSGFETEFAKATDWKFSTSDNWEYQNAQITATEKYSGTQSAIIGNNSTKSGYIGQRVTLKLETTYVLEAYVKGGGLNLRIGNGTKTYPDSNIVAQTNTESSDDWQKVMLEYTTYAWSGHTTAPFVVIIKNSDDYKDESGNYPAVYIDNVSLIEKTETTEPTTEPSSEPEETQKPTETEKPEETTNPTNPPEETTEPSLPPIKDNYESGVLEIGDSFNFDFGATASEGYISVEPTKDYFGGVDARNLTYGFLGLGEDGYSKTTYRDDAIQMDKDQRIWLENGGKSGAANAAEDNVYAKNDIRSENYGDKEYDKGDSVVPIRFAVKAAKQSYYKVKATVGCADTSKPAVVSVFSERRHPAATDMKIEAGKTATVEFTANVMDVYFKNDNKSYSDEMLTFMVSGENAGLASLQITRIDPNEAPVTIWVCSDSTGCDQYSYLPFYPLQNYSGVGQYLSKYLTDMTVSNQGEGGLATSDNAHLNMAQEQMRAGDYLYVEYGHNDSAPKDGSMTASEVYKSNLPKYYTAAHDKGAKLIIVAPIDRCSSAFDSTTGTWTPSLAGIRDAGKEFVEEKIAGGAKDIAFVDLNTAWVNFMNAETKRIAGVRGDTTYSQNAIHYYYTYNKLGASDRTHINDYGADNAAYLFYDALKDVVEADVEVQSDVLRPIYEDLRENVTPSKVSDEVIKDGYAPNSHYPAKFTARSEYPYSASIEDITKNEDGTLTARVRVLQDLTAYAAVYLTPYNAANEPLDVIHTTGEGTGHIDNTSDKAGAVKELKFAKPDAQIDHFTATVYYCDENDERLTEKALRAAVSPKYESRKVVKTLIDNDFSETTISSLDDGDSLIGKNGWQARTTDFTVTKESDDSGSYANFKAGTNSRYFYKALGENITNASGKLEITAQIRYKSGSVGIRGSHGVSSSKWGEWNPSGGGNITFSGTSVKNDKVDIGTVNTDEWIDYKVLIDFDNKTSEVYCGAYGVTESPITMADGKVMSQLLINSDSNSAGEIDIKNLTVRTVETYEFPAKPDEVQTSDPEDMSETNKKSLAFGGKAMQDEDDGIFGKTSEVYLLGNEKGSSSGAGFNTGANLYGQIYIAMDEESTAQLLFGMSGPGVRYQAINFAAGSSNEAETISAVTGESNRTGTASIALKPGKWYCVEYFASQSPYTATVTVKDINGETILTSDSMNPWGAFSTAAVYWNNEGSTGDVYIANSWLYSKSCGAITADSDNVTLTAVPTLIGEKKNVTITAKAGYTLDSITYNGTEVKATDNSAVVSVTGTAEEQAIAVAFAKSSESTPNITIDYVNEKLTGFTANSVYKINENEITPKTTEINAADYMGQRIEIVKKGDGTTIDSEPQTLEIPARPSAPTTEDFNVTQPSTIEGKGSISGITSAMEYSTDNGTTWTQGSGEIILNIDGDTTYIVRKRATDSIFKSDSYSIAINTFEAAQEQTPNIAIDYANEKLTGFTANSAYIINKNEITPETTEINAAGYIGQTISIVKKGNSTTTVDSEPQSLKIPSRPSAPSGIASIDESGENAHDGKITGVTAAMEYKLSTDSDWADITGNEITGLAHAAYNVRFKATDESFASEAVRVVVNAKGKYIITFNNYNGSELTHISVAEGTAPSYDGTPTREQDDRYTYEFIGWDSELVAATENKTYIAQYREIPRTYTVELNLNGGTINGESIGSYTYGTAVTLPTDITRDNYIFGGWYDNSECMGEAVTEISAAETGDKTYYAKWTENKITEFLDVLDAFKDKLTIEKFTDETGITLVISPLNDEVLPTLTLYSAIYSENKSLKSVTSVSYRADENGIIRISLSEPQINDGESYKLMLWTDKYAPVIEAINNKMVEFF